MAGGKIFQTEIYFKISSVFPYSFPAYRKISGWKSKKKFFSCFPMGVFYFSTCLFPVFPASWKSYLQKCLLANISSPSHCQTLANFCRDVRDGGVLEILGGKKGIGGEKRRGKRDRRGLDGGVGVFFLAGLWMPPILVSRTKKPKASQRRKMKLFTCVSIV